MWGFMQYMYGEATSFVKVKEELADEQKSTFKRCFPQMASGHHVVIDLSDSSPEGQPSKQAASSTAKPDGGASSSLAGVARGASYAFGDEQEEDVFGLGGDLD